MKEIPKEMRKEMEGMRRVFEGVINLLRNNLRHDGNKEQWVKPLREPLTTERPMASKALEVMVNVFKEDSDHDDNDMGNEFIGKDVQMVVGRNRVDGGYKLVVDFSSFYENLDIKGFLYLNSS